MCSTPLSRLRVGHARATHLVCEREEPAVLYEELQQRAQRSEVGCWLLHKRAKFIT